MAVTSDYPIAPSRLGALLVRRSVITAEQLLSAAMDQHKHGGQFTAALVRLGILSEEALISHLHNYYRLPIVDPQTLAPSTEVLALIPHAMARKHEILPVSLVGS